MDWNKYIDAASNTAQSYFNSKKPSASAPSASATPTWVKPAIIGGAILIALVVILPMLRSKN